MSKEVWTDHTSLTGRPGQAEKFQERSGNEQSAGKGNASNQLALGQPDFKITPAQKQTSVMRTWTTTIIATVTAPKSNPKVRAIATADSRDMEPETKRPADRKQFETALTKNKSMLHTAVPTEENTS